MIEECRLLRPFLKKMKTREQLAKMTVIRLRAYFHRTACDDGPGDEAKWLLYSNELLDAIQSARCKKGLPAELVDLFAAMFDMTIFTDPSSCLARDARCYHYVCHTSSLRGTHGDEILPLFVGGNKDTQCLYNIPSEEEGFLADSEQLTSVVREF